MSRIYPYAGFWRRAVALLVDSLIIGIVASVLYIAVLGTQFFRLMTQTPQNQDPKAFLSILVSMTLFQIFTFVFFWLYFALQESGKAQATVGKRVMGIKVVGADGGRISFWRATGRTFGKMVSNMTLYFGYYMAGFTKKRQALHDLMADTYVVQDSFQPGDEKPALRFSTGGLVASILAAIVPIVFIVLMMFIGFLSAISEVSDSDFNEDPDMAAFQLQSKALGAQGQLLLLGLDAKEKVSLGETDGVVYSKDQDGYRAEFTDQEQQRFVLHLKEGEYAACCAEGNCKLIQVKPCK